MPRLITKVLTLNLSEENRTCCDASSFCAVAAGLLHERVANPSQMLLCCDGCFKMTNLDVVLLTVGLLFKDLNTKTHSLGFHEVIYGIFRSESEDSFNQLFDTLFQAVDSIVGWNLQRSCLQLHGGFAPGLEASRLSKLPLCMRTDPCVTSAV